MKRLPQCFFAFLVLVAFSANTAEIYVSVNGSDSNPGTKDKPLATLPAALRKARELRRLNDVSITSGIHIILRGGTYQLNEPVFIRPEDAGTKASPTYIEAAPGQQPVLSGGVKLAGWKKLTTPIQGLPSEASGKIWAVDVPLVNGKLFEFRQLWINNDKAVRAKSMNGESMDRILKWNKDDETCTIPLPKQLSGKDAEGLEMFIHQWWAIAILRIRKMIVEGNTAKLFFYQPESRIQSEHPWPAPWISTETGNSAFFLSNAIQFLDEPGEWYLDISNRKLYYWPRQNENLLTATVIAPCLETLVIIQGTIDHPVSNVVFRGISFEHTGWLRPSHYGHVPHQTGMYMLDAYKLNPPGTPDKPALDNQAWIGRPAASVEISFAENTSYENCRFEHLASTALDYNKGVHDNVINGNLFKDIGGTAILAGVYSEETSEIHLPYNPKDQRDVCDHLAIRNNFITDAANEDWSCVGIGVGYARNTSIEHNEIENVSYTGISLGWGWNSAPNVMNNNKIIANRVHHYGRHNYDCSGIYTLSAQPGSAISDNYIDSIYKAPYAHLPSHWFYLYTDEGSSYFNISNNWTPSQKYLKNANGPGNEWINNGPQVAEAVKRSAGLGEPYQFLAKERTATKLRLPVNEEHEEVIELVTKENETLDIAKLKTLLSQNNADTSAIYQWQNHYVIFELVPDIMVLEGRLRKAFPGMEVKWYSDLFYEYSKKNNCNDNNVARDWTHVILTANLVADKKLQQQYLDYHATQFQKWPDVARGFCRANFQRLLLFRHGRQLMLAISIPKGSTLEALNPKTTENNPQMIEWNKRMAKYQEGIEGTKKGETWIFFKKL